MRSSSSRLLSSAGLGAAAVVIGCSSFATHVPGEYSGTLTRSDHAVYVNPSTRHTNAAGHDTALVTRTSGKKTFPAQKVRVVRVHDKWHPDGMALFHVEFGAGCSAAVVARAPKLVAETETGNRCACPVNGKAVRGDVMLDGSFDKDTNTLEWTAHVVLGGPEYGGGCTYTFKGTKAH